MKRRDVLAFLLRHPGPWRCGGVPGEVTDAAGMPLIFPIDQETALPSLEIEEFFLSIPEILGPLLQPAPSPELAEAEQTLRAEADSLDALNSSYVRRRRAILTELDRLRLQLAASTTTVGWLTAELAAERARTDKKS